MHKLVLRHRLHHEHALLPQMRQHLGDIHVEVVVHTVEEDVAEDRHAGPAHARRAVDEDGRVSVPARRHLRRRVLPERRELLQELDVGADVGGAAVV